MANLRAIDSLIHSLARWLQNSYDLERKAAADGGGDQTFLPAFAFEPVSSSALSREDFPDDPTAGADRVSIFLYRVAIDPHLRSAGRSAAPEMKPVPLSLLLYLLFSLWSTVRLADAPVARIPGARRLRPRQRRRLGRQ